MRDYFEIGSTPADEPCVQVSDKRDYARAMREECRIFKRQLERQFPDGPDGTYFTVRANPHDFGTYYEVAVAYSDDEEESAKFAYKVEDEAPANWDDEAIKELQSNEHIKAYYGSTLYNRNSA